MTHRPTSRSPAASRHADRPCRARLPAALFAALALLAGCQAGPARTLDAPGLQKLTWFDYLDATALRAGCVPGRPDRYRLVYNAHYAEQLRTYELTELADGSATLEAAAQEGTGIGLSLRTITLDDPTATWGWQRAARRLDAAGMRALRSALVESGATAPPEAGLRLRSNAFYWTAAGCLDGRAFWQAWLYDDGRFQGLSFPDRLFALDGTGVPVNPPRERDPGERTSANTLPRQSGAAYRVPYFVLEVGEAGEGLVGGPLF